MPRVQVQGVGVVQFPDDMTPDQITAAIEKDILPRAAMKAKSPTADDIRAQTAEGTGVGESMLIGAGKVADKVVSGVKQALLGGWLPESMQGDYTKSQLAKLKAEQDSNDAEYKPLAEAHPVATTVGEVAATLPFGVGGTGYRAAMAAGAAPALLEYGTAGDKGIGALAGIVGGALGQGAGDLIGKVVRRGATVELAAAERAALVDAAKARGYELRPDQITGKNWQRNLAAALQEHPGSSAVMERHAAKQTANTQRLVEDTLARAGGDIDQASAAAAAHEGIAKGVDREMAAVGKAYEDLLAGKSVDLEAARPALEAVLARQQKLPPSSQGAKAVDALRELLGTPGYGSKAAKPWSRPQIDPSKDDIVTAIRKAGGINPDDEAVGSLAKANPFSSDPRLGPVWSRPKYGNSTTALRSGGHGLDEMAGILADHGYPVNSGDDLMDAIANAGMDRPTLSRYFDHAAANQVLSPADEYATKQLAKEAEAAAAREANSAGWLRRQGGEVDGRVAQGMRSDYTARSEAGFANGRVQEGTAYAEMRQAVDNVIRDSVPEAEREQFASLNERYGLGVALKMLPKRDQHALLQDIYRGFKSEDEFSAFIAMSPDAEFQKVARGFLSNLVDKAKDKAGNVSAQRLGRATRGADPDAMRLLGGDNAAELATVGRIGEQLLPELPNSQTANRAAWLRALQNPLTWAGAGLGGAAGSGEGGPGGMAGAAAGAFLAPQVAARVYLSDLARRGIARAPSQYGGVPGLRDAMTPEVEAYLAHLLRGLSAGGALSLAD